MADGRGRDRIEALADAVVPEAVEWVKELKAYRTYQGKDAEYFRKARLGIGLIGAAARLLATIENARTNDAVELRLRLGGLTEPHTDIRPAITAGAQDQADGASDADR